MIIISSKVFKILISACSHFQLPAASLLWRAILQHILLELNPDLSFADQQVGRIGGKCKDFVEYARKSFEKLNMSDEGNKVGAVKNIIEDMLKKTFWSLVGKIEFSLA